MAQKNIQAYICKSRSSRRSGKERDVALAILWTMRDENLLGTGVGEVIARFEPGPVSPLPANCSDACCSARDTNRSCSVVLPEHRWCHILWVPELGRSPRQPAYNPGALVIEQ